MKLLTAALRVQHINTVPFNTLFSISIVGEQIILGSPHNLPKYTYVVHRTNEYRTMRYLINNKIFLGYYRKTS